MLQRNPAILILLQGKKLLSKTNYVYLPAISKQSGKISYMWNNANKIIPHNLNEPRKVINNIYRHLCLPIHWNYEGQRLH